MDRNEMEHVARVSGKEAAQETLIGLGVDTTKPIETQRDFAHLRWWREIAEGVMKAAVIAMAPLGPIIPRPARFVSAMATRP